MGFPRIAKTAVLNVEDVVFDVDGRPFPWWLPEGVYPRARKRTDDFYVVDVQFLAVIRDHEKTPCSFEQTEWEQPIINGVEFPWAIDETGVTFTVTRTDIPCVSLAFFAEHVVGMEIIDETSWPEDGKCRSIGSSVYAKLGPLPSGL